MDWFDNDAVDEDVDATPVPLLSRFNATTNGTETQCPSLIDAISPLAALIFLCVAVGVIFIHMLMARRKASGGRFAVAEPIDFLLISDRRRRFLYCLAYACSVAGVFNVIFGPTPTSVSGFVGNLESIGVKVLLMCATSLLYYPIFISVRTAQSLVGSGIGFLYTASLMAAKIVFLAECKNTLTLIFTILGNLPGTLALLGVIGYLAMKLLKQVHAALESKSWKLEPGEDAPILDEDEKSWQTAYVKRLFRPVSTQNRKSMPLSARMKLKLYDSDHPFQYSMRILISLLVSACIIYYIVIAVTVFLINVEESSKDKTSKVGLLIRYVAAVVYVAALLAAIISAAQLYYIGAHYRRDMLLMYQGRHGSQRTRVKVADLMFKPLKQNHFTAFASYQAVMVIMGFVYQFILLSLLASAIGGIVYLGNVTTWSNAAQLVLLLSLPLLSSLFLFALQHIVVFFLFMEKGGKESLIIDNRRIYNNFAYFMFFWNMMIGIMTAILRLVTSFLISSIMVSRLSRSVNIAGYEGWDRSHTVYIDFLRMENELTNPSLVVFARHMLAVLGRVRGHPSYIRRKKDDHNCPMANLGYRVSKIARNRWLVARMMLANPAIIPTRRGSSSNSSKGGVAEDDRSAFTTSTTVALAAGKAVPLTSRIDVETTDYRGQRSTWQDIPVDGDEEPLVTA